MFLKSLEIKNSQNEVIRTINFKRGLNLVTDLTSKRSEDSGNNVGKTTLLRIIDYCLGGDKKDIYTDKEFKKPDEKILNFLTDNGIKFVLQLEGLRNSKIEIIRPFEGKSFINKEEVSSDDVFKKEIRKILFGFDKLRPTLGQLMNKFIRVETYQLDKMLYFLTENSDHSEYESLFLFLFGFKNMDVLASKRETLLRYKNFKKKSKAIDKELDDLEQQLGLILNDIDKYENIKADLNFSDNFTEHVEDLTQYISRKTALKNIIENTELKMKLQEDNINELNSMICNDNSRSLKLLYEEAKVNLGDLNKQFEDVISFHNSMIQNKINFLKKNIKSSQKSLLPLKIEMEKLLNAESFQVKILKDRGSLSEYDRLSESLYKLYEEKGSKETAINQIRDINNNLKELTKTIHECNEIIEGSLTEYKNSLKEFNKIFSEYSKSLYGEQLYLSIYEKEGENTGNFLLNLGDRNQNFGTGKKKGQISAFDLAYLHFSINCEMTRPYFVLHDQLETVFVNQIGTLFDFANKSEGQFLVTLLSDKLTDIKPDIVDNNTCLVLSQEDKLFKIP